MEQITNDMSVDMITERTLRLLGLNRSYKGFAFLKYGMKLVLEDPDILTYICKGFYVEVAAHFNTSVNCAERNIRTVKELAWQNGNEDVLRDIFGCLYGCEMPTNASFIDTLSCYVKNVMQNEAS